jgi:hypothetical protein
VSGISISLSNTRPLSLMSPVDKVPGAYILRMAPTVQPNLMSQTQRLLVHIRQIRPLICQRISHREECDVDVFLLEDLEHLLRQLGDSVIDRKGEGVGDFAFED